MDMGRLEEEETATAGTAVTEEVVVTEFWEEKFSEKERKKYTT